MRRHIMLLAALVSTVPAVAESAEPGGAAPYVASRNSDAFEQSLECLTQAVYYEARNQSEDGQRAVAQVVLNRVRHPSYPDNVCGVVYQGSERATGCQFSFTCDGSMYRDIEPAAWDYAQEIAREALSGSVYRPVGLALNYHTISIRPYWAPSLVRQTVVGAHIFYRRPDSTEASFTQNPGEEVVAASSAVSRSVAERPAPAARARAQRLRYETEVVEIPVLERPVRYRTVSASRSPVTRPTTSRPAAARRAGPRVSIESGVRVARGN